MKDRTSAHRYARALEVAAADETEFARLVGEVGTAARIVAADATVEAALTNPAIEPGRKKGLLETLGSAAGFSPRTTLFLGVLADHGHLSLLGEVAEAAGSILDRRRGIAEAEVTSATPLPPETTERVRQALEQATGRKVRISVRTDPSLIGGIVARVGSTVFDGSVQARLDALRAQLAES
jgi:F-type H+-transporting ATPase subunit delta